MPRCSSWALLLMGSAQLFGQTYPTAPVYTNQGNLKCGIRLFTANQVQTWCYTLPNPLTLVHNTISTIQPGNVVNYGFVQGPDQILWIISELGLPGNIQYQVNSSDDPNKFSQGLLASTGTPNPLPQFPPLAHCVFFCCADDGVAASFSIICSQESPPVNLPTAWQSMSMLSVIAVN